MVDRGGLGGDEIYGQRRGEVSGGSADDGRGFGSARWDGGGGPADGESEYELTGLSLARMGLGRPRVAHPLRTVLTELCCELTLLEAEGNRESGPIGFHHYAAEPVSIGRVRHACRAAAAQLDLHVDAVGDRSIVAVKWREIALVAQAAIREFDVFITQSNFRQGVVPASDLPVVLLSARNLHNVLGLKLLEVDELQARIREAGAA